MKKKRLTAKARSHKPRAKARRVIARSSRSTRSVRARRAGPTVKRATVTRASRARLKARTKPVTKPVAPVVATSAQKTIRKPQPRAVQKAITRMAARTTVAPRPRPAHRLEASRPARPAVPVRNVNRQLLRMVGAQQFNYMKAPGSDTGFEVGDGVEVFCDHERDGERIRGWIKGVVVQVDNKLVAVQFRTNVFLTDGWMVPDRILWYSLTSDQIRSATFGKKSARRPIPEY